MTITAVHYDQRQAGDLIVVQAPPMEIPTGWTNLTWNRDTNEKVVAYRYYTAGDRDIREVWGEDGVTVATFRGAAGSLSGAASTCDHLPHWLPRQLRGVGLMPPYLLDH